MAGELAVLTVVALALAYKVSEDPGAGPAEDRADMAAAARGDQAALARLYDRHARLVFSLALRVAEDRAAAEEITQDVFLLLWRRASAFDPARGDLVSWLLTLTRNRAIDRRRSRHQRASAAWVPLEESPPLASRPAQLSLEAAQRVGRVLAQLPETQRQVIELAYYEGLTQSEIAQRLNQPLGTVKTWTRSALQALREALQS